jgi:hypothetical protein
MADIEAHSLQPQPPDLFRQSRRMARGILPSPFSQTDAIEISNPLRRRTHNGSLRSIQSRFPSSYGVVMKKKLKLDIDTLSVESFASTDIPGGRGTIRARADISDGSDCGNAGTVFANLCYPNSNIMDCWYEEGASVKGCVTPM